MKIQRVVIKNFRSIQQVDFEPGSLCALVGENNAGKSTILVALNLVLGEQFPPNAALTRATSTEGAQTIRLSSRSTSMSHGTSSEHSAGRLEVSASSAKRTRGKRRTRSQASYTQTSTASMRTVSRSTMRKGTYPRAQLRVTGPMRERVPLLLRGCASPVLTSPAILSLDDAKANG